MANHCVETNNQIVCENGIFVTKSILFHGSCENKLQVVGNIFHPVGNGSGIYKAADAQPVIRFTGEQIRAELN